MVRPSNAAPPERSSPPPGERRRSYKGVRLRKWGRWVSEIRLPNSRERIWLGSYDTPEKAARAFDAAYLCLRGPGGAGGLNFPGSPPDVGRTSDPEEVYAAAVSHANRAAAVDAAAPWDDATEQPSEPHDGSAPVHAAAVPPAPAAAPLQVPARSSDWAQLLMADLPPLFSPTYAENHGYLPVSPTAADVNMDEIGSGSCPGLWSFDPSGAPVTHHVDI
ncbi:hypothetical protein C2845_PM10G05410 [Panicum miliaceum]|uniref:AP2/ERF domain-containing protein n=1 Tax=Panicum miliaceum TaxID=4540 RepID=A0A3L6PBF8_PANMI|nr:hypothetical protein C2845_PM10G05410 [Panicum miliaceum]